MNATDIWLEPVGADICRVPDEGPWEKGQWLLRKYERWSGGTMRVMLRLPRALKLYAQDGTHLVTKEAPANGVMSWDWCYFRVGRHNWRDCHQVHYQIIYQGWIYSGRQVIGNCADHCVRMRRTRQSHYLNPPLPHPGVTGNRSRWRFKNPVLDLIDGMWRVSDGDQVRWWAKTFSNGRTYFGLEPADIINQRMLA